MASFGGGISRDSLFVKELEDEFARIISGINNSRFYHRCCETVQFAYIVNTLVETYASDIILICFKTRFSFE